MQEIADLIQTQGLAALDPSTAVEVVSTDSVLGSLLIIALAVASAAFGFCVYLLKKLLQEKDDHRATSERVFVITDTVKSTLEKFLIQGNKDK